MKSEDKGREKTSSEIKRDKLKKKKKKHSDQAVSNILKVTQMNFSNGGNFSQ